MNPVTISDIQVEFSPYSYSIQELVDDIFVNKLDKEVRDFAKNQLGISRVYKAYDFQKMDFDNTDFVLPQIKLNDMYVNVAKKILNSSQIDDIGFLITINDNQENLDPSPTVEVVSRLGLKNDIRTQNFQGLACSSFSEAVLNAAGHFALGNTSDVLVLIGTFYTSWFLDRIKQIKHISKNDNAEFLNFIYFLIFSDVSSGAILSNNKADHSLAQINTNSILSLKDNKDGGYKKATIKLSPDKEFRMIFDMSLDAKLLKENVASLSSENLLKLQKKFPEDWEKIRMWGFHTAGARFVDYVREKCNVAKSQSKLSYDLMKETGNTGAVSSMQIIKEAIDRKFLNKNELGCIIDYGWEGVNTFLFKSLR